MIFKKIVFSFSILGLMLSYGCKHHPNYNGQPITDSPCDPQTVYFQNTILPLLNSKCGMPGCHDASSHQEGINVSTYSSLMGSGGEGQLVVPYDAGGSKLYEVIVNGSMPPNPYSNLTPTEINLITTWINQGALNNYCADCDTTKFMFGADIWPIISGKCSGCHGAVNPNGSTTLLNYTNVFAIVSNGKLADVLGGVNLSLMPPSVGLPDCEKTKILKWINNGAPNN